MRRLIFILSLFALSSFSLLAQEEELSLQDNSWSVAVITETIEGGYEWNNDVLEETEVAQLEGFSFVDVDSLNDAMNDCDYLACLLEKAAETGAKYVIYVPVSEDDFLTLYDPKTGDKLQSFMMEDIVTVLGDFVDSILDTVIEALSATDSSAVDTFSLATSDTDTTWSDSTGAIFTFNDSLANDSLMFTMDSSYVDSSIAIDTTFLDSSFATDIIYDAELQRLNSATYKIKQRFLRSFIAYHNNPSNLGHESETFFTLGLPAIDITTYNTIINQGILSDLLLDEDGFFDDDEKAAFTENFAGKTIKIRNNIELPSIVGLRFGPVGIDVSAHVNVNVDLPGDLITLPFSGLTFDKPLNLNLNAEILDYTRAGISIGHEFKTSFGNIRAGIGGGAVVGTGYANFHTDYFVIESGDSLNIRAAGTAIVTDPNIGKLADPNFDNIDIEGIMSNPGYAIDLGVGYDFFPLIGMELDMNIAVKNLLGEITYDHAKISRFTADSKFENVTVAIDSMTSASDNDEESLDMLNYLFSSNEEVINADSSITITIPPSLYIGLTFQPIRFLMLQAQFEQGFDDGFNTETELRSLYMAHLYPFKFLRLSAGISNYYGENQYRGGLGFMFKYFDLNVDVASVGDLADEFKGIQFMFSSSIYLF